MDQNTISHDVTDILHAIQKLVNEASFSESDCVRYFSGLEHPQRHISNRQLEDLQNAQTQLVQEYVQMLEQSENRNKRTDASGICEEVD